MKFFLKKEREWWDYNNLLSLLARPCCMNLVVWVVEYKLDVGLYFKWNGEGNDEDFGVL